MLRTTSLSQHATYFSISKKQNFLHQAESECANSDAGLMYGHQYSSLSSNNNNNNNNSLLAASHEETTTTATAPSVNKKTKTKTKKTFTFLRHPLARVPSLYHYIRRSKHHHLHSMVSCRCCVPFFFYVFMSTSFLLFKRKIYMSVTFGFQQNLASIYFCLSSLFLLLSSLPCLSFIHLSSQIFPCFSHSSFSSLLLLSLSHLPLCFCHHFLPRLPFLHERWLTRPSSSF